LDVTERRVKTLAFLVKSGGILGSVCHRLSLRLDLRELA
jgi:hypothetical protein